MEPLHESGGRKAAAHKNITEEVRQSPRRPGSESRGGNQNEDSFTDLRPPSITSIPTGSWESSGDGSPSRIPRGRADRRKIIDNTTPTLIDEHDVSEDEEEMVSLARDRLHREMMMHGDAAMNRTPGGAMFSSESAAESMRRTPGAIAMQASSRHTSVSATEVSDAALLGFGLTLTTPVAPAGKRGVTQQLSADSFSSSSSSSQTGATNRATDGDQGQRLSVNTNIKSHDPSDRSYTPAGWTLSKNPHLEVRHGAFSPNTLRLTEDLDNLLLDDEDAGR